MIRSSIIFYLFWGFQEGKNFYVMRGSLGQQMEDFYVLLGFRERILRIVGNFILYKQGFYRVFFYCQFWEFLGRDVRQQRLLVFFQRLQGSESFSLMGQQREDFQVFFCVKIEDYILQGFNLFVIVFSFWRLQVMWLDKLFLFSFIIGFQGVVGFIVRKSFQVKREGSF